MMVGRTGGDDRGRIIGLGDLEQGMLGAAGQDRAQEQGLDPSQDGLQKSVQQSERERGQGGQVGERHLPGAWYTDTHTASLRM